LIHGLSARWCPMSPHFLTRRVSRLLGWLWHSGLPSVLVSVHRLSLRLPYLGVYPFTLHLPLDFIRVFPLRPMYLHPFGRPLNPSLTHFLGEFPDLVLPLEPDVVVPEAEHYRGVHGAEISIQIFALAWVEPRTLESIAAANVTNRPPRTPPFNRLLRHAGYTAGQF